MLHGSLLTARRSSECNIFNRDVKRLLFNPPIHCNLILKSVDPQIFCLSPESFSTHSLFSVSPIHETWINFTPTGCEIIEVSL